MSTIKLQIEESADLAAILQQVEISVRGKAMKQGIRAAAKIVVNEAKRRVPQSRQTGTRKHNSLAYRNKYGNPPKPLRQTIGQLERTYRDGEIFVGLVGAKRPAGSHGHLVEGGHVRVLWGRKTGGRVEGKKWLAPAVDTTMQQQDQAMKAAVASGIKAAGG